MKGKALKVLMDCWCPGFGEFKAGQIIRDPEAVKALSGAQAFKVIDAKAPAEPAPSKREG